MAQTVKDTLGLKDKMHAVRGKAIRDALVAEGGIIARSARRLEMSPSLLRYTIENHYPDLLVESQRLRRKRGNVRGRPRGDAPSEKRVSAAWKKSRHVIAECARILRMPASTCRELLVRYGMLD